MSEDRLEKALEAIINESVPAEESVAARARVWEKLAVPAVAICGEFQPKLKDYLEHRLAESRRLLMEDHLGRCPECRRELAALKGERKPLPMPQRRSASWPMWKGWAVAAGLALVVLYTGRHRIDALLAPGGPRMTVEMVSGELYRLPEGALNVGSVLGEGEVVRAGVGARAVLRLADGSAVEVNERSELFVSAAWSGQTIHLRRGDVIVQAAKQRRGTLRVQTRDSRASVQGTVFAVSAGVAGSVVSVLEGAVEVSQPGSERLLKPGEQAVSNPALQPGSVREAVSWSRDAEKYLALLADFALLEKQITAIPPPALRTQPRLLQYLPPNVFVYTAVPNLSGTIRQALALAEQQAAQSEAFGEWWGSEAGKQLRQIVDHLQTVTPLLGDEICFVGAHSAPGGKEKVPVLLAEVQAGRRDAVAHALAAIRVGRDAGSFFYVTDRLMVLSDSTTHLQWALARLGQGASGSFANEIARRYQRGAGWLTGVDFAAFDLSARTGPAAEATGVGRMKHLFLEQRSAQGGEENEATLMFQGARTGIASWLAPGGASGAAEYISSDAVAAFSASTRQPRQVFEEFTAQMARIQPRFPAELQEIETKLGLSIAGDIAAAIGTEFAIAIERPSVPGPGWIAAVVVYKPAALDGTIRRLVDVFNRQPENQKRRLTLEQETANGRVWNTLKSATNVSLTWTYDRGYLVAGADRALAARAIATREGGFPLIWSASFRRLLPPSTPLHPSGFAWLNTRGALQGLAALVPNAPINKLVSDRDALLVVINGKQEQIHAASRTRLTSLALDLMTASVAARAGGRTRSRTGP